MKNITIFEDHFVKPYFIEELGCDGLLCEDIAVSLKSRPADVRKKLIERGFLDRIKIQGFQATAIAAASKSNGLDFTEYALDVDAAKFFVGKYDSFEGDRYLGFLVRLEKKVTALSTLTKNDPVLRNLSEAISIRVEQLEHAKKIQAHEEKIVCLEEGQESMMLNTIQKKHLKKLIDSTAYAYGDPKFIGRIQKDLKRYFGLNTTNDKWYHIAQKDYEKAVEFVRSWGRS